MPTCVAGAQCISTANPALRRAHVPSEKCNVSFAGLGVEQLRRWKKFSQAARQCRLESARWSKSSTGKQRRFSRVRGMADEEGTSSTEKSSAAAAEVDSSMSTGTSTSNSVGNKKAAVRAEVERGRNTAILTGAISVLLGVGYLVLVQLLDTRGIELIPPPPEAFDP